MRRRVLALRRRRRKLMQLGFMSADECIELREIEDELLLHKQLEIQRRHAIIVAIANLEHRDCTISGILTYCRQLIPADLEWYRNHVREHLGDMIREGTVDVHQSNSDDRYSFIED